MGGGGGGAWSSFPFDLANALRLCAAANEFPREVVHRWVDFANAVLVRNGGSPVPRRGRGVCRRCSELADTAQITVLRVDMRATP